MGKTVSISLVANARDSIGRMTREIDALRVDLPVSCKGTLLWGWHATALLVYMRLLPARDRLDPWLWDYLVEGESALDVDRDAHWENRQRLSLLEIVDILSEVELPLLKPEFYQGWQDRTTRCQTLRSQAAAIIGSSIGDEQRQGLLLLLAAYHRLLRLPAAVELEAAPIVAALFHLLDLMESLVDAESVGVDAVLAAIREARSALARQAS